MWFLDINTLFRWCDQQRDGVFGFCTQIVCSDALDLKKTFSANTEVVFERKTIQHAVKFKVLLNIKKQGDSQWWPDLVDELAVNRLDPTMLLDNKKWRFLVSGSFGSSTLSEIHFIIEQPRKPCYQIDTVGV